MKKSDQLKLDKAAKIKRMQEIVTVTEGASARALTTEEQTEWDGLDTEVRALVDQIRVAERMESFGNNDPEPQADDTGHQRSSGSGPHIAKKPAPYNVGKAIREYALGGVPALSGIEKEQHEELSRGISDSQGLLVPYQYRDANTTSHATSIDTVIDPNLSILGKEPLWSKMGMTVLPGLQGAIKLGKKTPDEAGKYSEKSAVTATSNVPSFITLSPERFGITDIFTKELLAQANPAVQAAIVNDMIKGADRKISAEAYAVALAAATEVAAGALTTTGFNALMAAVDADGAFAMTRATFFAAKNVKVDTGSGRFLAALSGENGVGNTYDGAKILYSNLFADGANKQYAIYGAWSEIYLGFWGALEILINPYTYQKNGQIEMTVNRLADIACRNAAAFVRTPDLDATT